MTRLKFLLFAAAVLGLWLGHLPLLTPALVDRAVEQAAAKAELAGSAVGLRLERRRTDLQAAALKALGVPAVAQALRSGATVSEERFSSVRQAVTEILPLDLRPFVIVALVADDEVLYAHGKGDVLRGSDRIDFVALAKDGPMPVARHVLGERFIFTSLSTFLPDSKQSGGVRLSNALVLGVPLLYTGFFDKLSEELGYGALSLAVGGMVVASGGPEKDLLLRSADAMPTNSRPVIVSQAHVPNMSVGPVRLPVLAGRADGKGSGGPSWVGARIGLVDTPYEVLCLVSLTPFMRSLAEYQRFALLAFVGLLGLTVVWTVLIREPRYDDDEEEADDPRRAPTAEAAVRLEQPLSQQARINTLPPAASPVEEPRARSTVIDRPVSAPPPSPASAIAPPPVAPEPDAFNDEPHTLPIPAGPPVAASKMNGSGVEHASPSDGFSFEPSRPAVMEGPPGDDEVTSNAPPEAPPVPFGEYAPEPAPPEYNAEQTRVAMIPPELLEAISQPESRALTAEPSGVHVSTDDVHFQEVFHEFLATRERCGELSDGLTYDKFAGKLRKNREQLVQKYQCRTVRFQVYVKEGRAALKATPIRE